MKIAISFSSGKDSMLALYKLQQDSENEIESLLVTLTEGVDHVSIHGVRYELLKEQAKSLNIPIREVWLPKDCPNETYQEIMNTAFTELKNNGVTHIAYGDIHLKDIRNFREKLLEGTGLIPIFPLWGIPVEKITQEFISLGFKAVLTCVDLDKLDRKFSGTEYDQNFINNCPNTIDLCGENGEFHTFVFDGPNFENPIEFNLGAHHITGDFVTKKDRYLYIDLLPTTTKKEL